jgi:hypothetical protein
MKTLLLALLLLTSQLGVHAMENEFIRKPGTYPLDPKGSTLTIEEKPQSTWTLKLTRVTPDSQSTASPEDCLRATGWFVFVEKPNRIWVFNGVDGGLLMEHTEKSMTVSALYSGNMTNCPKAFLDALPPKARAKILGNKPANKE